MPFWVYTVCHPSCQHGSKNFFYSMQLLRSVSEEIQAVAKPIYQRNSYWAHHENLLLAMVKDNRREVRSQAVQFIQKSRKEFKLENGVRKFKLEELNWATT